MSNATSQPTVFLSYAHDDRVKAQRLAAALAERGYTVWWDGLIEGGAQFAKSIREALEAADAVIVLWSKKQSNPIGCATRPRRARPAPPAVPLSLDGSCRRSAFASISDRSGAWRGKATHPRLSHRRAIVAATGRLQSRDARPVPDFASGVNRRRAIGLTAGAGAVALVGGGLLMGHRLVGPASAEASIVVLPFQEYDRDPAQVFSPTACRRNCAPRSAATLISRSRRKPRLTVSAARRSMRERSPPRSTSPSCFKAASAARPTCCASPRRSSTARPASTNGRKALTARRPTSSASRAKSRPS